MSFQSTSPVRGTTKNGKLHYCKFVISIHVPREGDDRRRRCPMGHQIQISIHVPREGDDKEWTESDYRQWNFNPRPP